MSDGAKFGIGRTTVARGSTGVEPSGILIPVSHLDEPAPDAIELTTVLQALGDPVRLRIVRELAEAEAERTCGTFELGVSKATLSHHFRVLREAGVTHTRIEGTHRHVSLRREDLEAIFPGLLGAVLERQATAGLAT
jgi:DNA-binding transcriptional ArsR family regulator